MEFDLWWSIVAVVLGTYVFILGFLKNINQWYYVSRLGEKQELLPPGDMGWPFIGNMFSFLRAFTSQDPKSFINNLIKRYGRTGIYKTHLFWRPTIIVCSPEMCKRVLTDNETFSVGYSPSVNQLAGKTSLHNVSPSQHRDLRKLIAPSISGHEALSMYIRFIEEIVITSLEEWANMNQPIVVIKEMKNITFKAITTIFFGSIGDLTLGSLLKYYPDFAYGYLSALINVPNFSFRKALTARTMLKRILRAELEERKEGTSNKPDSKRGMIDLLKEVEDKQGEKLEDEYILDLLLLCLFAGHESLAHATTWSIIYLHNNPDTLQKAKEKQEMIIKRRSPSQKGLTLLEIKEMKYLAKVIDETLQMANSFFAQLRESKLGVSIDGYTIRKGWAVLVWSRAVHMDPENYSNPKEFLPSRSGNMICPGADLAKLEMSIFLHYFLLNYKLEQLNPRGPINYLPSTHPADNCLAKIIKHS